jgi:hypothetical protein
MYSYRLYLVIYTSLNKAFDNSDYLFMPNYRITVRDKFEKVGKEALLV